MDVPCHHKVLSVPVPEVPSLLPSLMERGLKEAEDGESTRGGITCPKSEPGSISRDGGRFQLRCLYKHVIKTTAEKQPGCSAGGGEGKSQKSPWPCLLLQLIHMTSRTWGCSGETRQRSRAQPVRLGSERVSQAGPRLLAEHTGRGKAGGKCLGTQSEPIP